MTQKHTVILQPSGRRGQVDEGTSIRAAARELGVEIESICAENATCGKCMVLVEEGRFEKYNIESKREHLSPMGGEERAYLERRPKLLKDKGWEIGQVRLSCQCKVLGDVLINVPEESRGNKQIVRKSAGERAIEIKPSVRKYYVLMTPPNLELVVDISSTGVIRRDAATGEWFIEGDDDRLFISSSEFPEELLIEGTRVSFQGRLVSEATPEEIYTVVEIQTLLIIL